MVGLPLLTPKMSRCFGFQHTWSFDQINISVESHSGKAGLLVEWQVWVVGAVGMASAGWELGLLSPPQTTSFSCLAKCPYLFMA